MITLYHNNRCSKSREALALLEQSGKAFTVRYYLEQPLSAAELMTLLKALQLANPVLSEQQLIDAMVLHPKLMERPVLQVGNQAVIARPADKMQALLA